MSKNSLKYIGVFFIAFVVLLLVCFAVSYYAHDTVLIKEISHRDIAFNSESTDPALSAIKEFSEESGAGIKELAIKFKMRVISIHNWNNIFQTAPYNKGVRMELSDPAGLGLVVGDGTETGLRGYKISGPLELNKWYSVSVNIDVDKRIKVFLNDELILDIVDEKIAYDITSIAVGTGFSKTRPFFGEIKDFSIKYKLFDKCKPFWKRKLFGDQLKFVALAIAVILLGVSSVFLIWALYRRFIFGFVMLLVAAILLVSSIFVKRAFYQPVLVKSITHGGINFNSNSTDPGLSSVKEFRENTVPQYQEIKINFKMKVDSTQNWGNVFQTATFNKGVRMELASPSSLFMAVGDGTETGLVGYLITDSLKLGEWYSVRLRIDKHKNIKVLLGDEIVVNVRDNKINYFINDIAVGTGFAKTRPFDGEIKDFSLRYSFYKENDEWKSVAAIFLFFYLLIISLSVNVLLKQQKA